MGLSTWWCRDESVKRLRVEVTKGKRKGLKSDFQRDQIGILLVLGVLWSSTDKSKKFESAAG
jgi:hypothetical protein